MRISDWSSDVCSSDLLCLDSPTKRQCVLPSHLTVAGQGAAEVWGQPRLHVRIAFRLLNGRTITLCLADAMTVGDAKDRKRVVSGKSVSGRVDLGGRRIIKKKKRPLTSRNKNKQ